MSSDTCKCSQLKRTILSILVSVILKQKAYYIKVLNLKYETELSEQRHHSMLYRNTTVEL